MTLVLFVQLFSQFLFARFQQFVTFSFGGLVSTGVNYGVLYLFLGRLGLAAAASIAIAFALSTGTNFAFQKFLTFRDKRREMLKRQASLYLLANGLMLAVNYAVFFLLFGFLHVNYLATQTAATLVVGVIGYVATRRIFAPALAHTER